MGGHGGLNILPQKRWNVYGRRNRLKVHEDEEKHRQEQEAHRRKQEAAEQEFRTSVLRKRSLKDSDSTDAKIEHVNFFKEQELNLEDPESKELKELEDRKRGRKEDRTSDAKFDEKFAFGYGVKDSKPWYARPAVRHTEPPVLLPVNSEVISTKPKNKDKKKKHSKKEEKKKKLAKELLRELKQSKFKKSEINSAMLKIERDRREKKEKERSKQLRRQSSSNRAPF
eukprot:g2512.t1